MQRVEVSRVIPASPADVFARFNDHAGWTAWAGVGKVALEREGKPDKNGLGAVRAFPAPMSLQEEVIEFEPPTFMAYKIVRGGRPVKDHRGEVHFEPHPRGTRVVWTVNFRSSLPFTERLIASVLRRAFTVVLKRFENRAMH